MKKTWKERLYDVSCSRFAVRHNPTLPLGLALLSIVCGVVFEMLFDWILLPMIFYYMFLFLPIVGWSLQVLFDAVRSYNKETFCCNNIRTSLLANEFLVIYVLFNSFAIVLALVAYIIFRDDSYGARVTFVGSFLLLGLSIVISKPISKHFKKKIVHIEKDEK